MLSMDMMVSAKEVNIEVQREVSGAVYFKASWEAQDGYRLAFHPKTLDGLDTGGTKITKSYPSDFYVFKRSCNKTHRIDLYWVPKSKFTSEEYFIQTVIIDNCQVKQEYNPNPSPEPPPDPEPNPEEPPEESIGEVTIKGSYFDSEHVIVEWNPYTNADKYRVFQNGEFLIQTNDLSTPVLPYSEIIVEALDSAGNVIARSKVFYSDYLDENIGEDGLGQIDNFEVYEDGFLAWDHYPNAIYYEVNGERTYNNFIDLLDPDLDGDYQVIAYDHSGNPIAQSTTNACFTQLCNCIRELLPVLEQIDSNTGHMIRQLQDLLGTSEQLRYIAESIKFDTGNIVNNTSQIANNTKGILEELQTNNNYSSPSTGDYKFPTLEENKPPMREGKFEDKNTYFRDQGDDPSPPPLPVAPEPTDQWSDGNGGIVKKQSPIKPNEVLKRSSVLSRDSVLEKDAVLKKSPALKRDQPMETKIEQGSFIWTAEQYREREGRK